MQLQDAFSIPKIHWFRYSQKSWTVSIQTDLFFHKTYSMPSNAEDLYQYVERTFPDHAVDLVYEGLLRILRGTIFFKLGLECSSC
jgi:hypothetical protein